MEKAFTLSSDRIRANASAYVQALLIEKIPWQVRIARVERTRTVGQNSRYWATLTETLRRLRAHVHTLADESGHTPLEIRRLLATELEPENVALLFVRTPEAAHEIVKMICDVPTSTRLNTRKFMAFEDRMVAVLGELIGHVESCHEG